jgi:SAM-dependent methyltransferase
MTSDLAINDLPALARAGWTLGESLCTACGGFHRVWGTLRCAGVVGGVEADEAVLLPLLRDLTPDGTRAFIGGSADPGILEILLRAAQGRSLDVVVTDLCPTPLAVIETLAPQPGLTLTTEVMDITQLDVTAGYDLILSHSLLPFLTPSDRHEALMRMRRALAPGGHLVIAARTASPLSAEEAADHDEAWLSRAWARIAARDCDLPGPREAFEPLLEAFAAERPKRLWDLGTPEAISAMFEAAGLEILSCQESRATTALNLAGKVKTKQSYMFVTRESTLA